MTRAYKGSRDEILALQAATKTYREATKGLKKEDKESLDRAIVATSNDFLRHYEFERQLEYSRFIAKRDQEKEQRRQVKEDQERQKRLERIAKEEQKIQKEEQPKPPAPTAEAVERATPPMAKPQEKEVEALSVAQARALDSLSY
jgi:hypothetical protein